jgi:endonuclease/exonuclease/phosphatase (EEP) superfamily protein YafD
MRVRFACLVPVALAAWFATAACAKTHNYLDPTGPKYEGNYADPAAPCASRPADGPIRVVTFNIEFAREIDKAVALLRDRGPLKDFDILLLQEMDAPGVERIARELRLNYVYFPSTVHPTAHRDFGTAVLSPWPLDEARKLLLPHAAFGTRARRAATSAVVHRGALRIRAVALHLSAPGAIRDEEREEQVRLIIDDAARTGDAVVVGGDFNSRSVSRVFESAGFLWLTGRLPGTSRGMGRWWSYDHVFARGLAAAVDGPAAGVVDPAGASDHRAVWVRLVPQNVRNVPAP